MWDLKLEDFYLDVLLLWHYIVDLFLLENRENFLEK